MEEVDGYVGDLNEIFPQHWGPRKARLENTLRITGQACGDMKGCRHFLQTGLKFLSEICNWAGECASSRKKAFHECGKRSCGTVISGTRLKKRSQGESGLKRETNRKPHSKHHSPARILPPATSIYLQHSTMLLYEYLRLCTHTADKKNRENQDVYPLPTAHVQRKT